MAKAPTMDEWAEKLGTIALNSFEYNGKILREWIDLMASGYCVVLPNGATNGDVIKILFPEIPRTLLFHIENHMGQEWWNAPYKGGKE